MKRAIDKPYFTYCVRSALKSGIYVKCPECNGLSMITSDENAFYFKCTNCYHTETIEKNHYRYKVENLCDNCGRYYRVKISDGNQNFSTLRVACPYCKYIMPGKVQKILSGRYEAFAIRNGCVPLFKSELWFLTNYKGKPIWALNREHLTYLIEYLSADLREEPPSSYPSRTQADNLPAFMKTAKNRDSIVKCLETMLRK